VRLEEDHCRDLQAQILGLFWLPKKICVGRQQERKINPKKGKVGQLKT
jgi:hypothetical protein